MRLVGIKTPEQQSVLHVHRSRQLLVKSRISISNHLRGLLAEFGVVIPVGVKAFERQVLEYLEDESLPALSRHSIGVMGSAYVAQQAQTDRARRAYSIVARGDFPQHRPNVRVQSFLNRSRYTWQ